MPQTTHDRIQSLMFGKDKPHWKVIAIDTVEQTYQTIIEEDVTTETAIAWWMDNAANDNGLVLLFWPADKPVLLPGSTLEHPVRVDDYSFVSGTVVPTKGLKPKFAKKSRKPELEVANG